MVSQPDQPSSETARSRPSYYLERGGPVMEFRQARNRVLDRLDAARAAGDEEDARRLEEEAEVLLWKRRMAAVPDLEVPATIREKFDKFDGHPPLPSECHPFM